MEPECSLPRVQVTVTFPYLEPYQSIACYPFHLLKIHLNIVHLHLGLPSGIFPSPCVRQGTENHKQDGNVLLLIIFAHLFLYIILRYCPELLEGRGIMDEDVEGGTCGLIGCTGSAVLEGLRKWRIITDQTIEYLYCCTVHFVVTL